MATITQDDKFIHIELEDFEQAIIDDQSSILKIIKKSSPKVMGEKIRKH